MVDSLNTGSIMRSSQASALVPLHVEHSLARILPTGQVITRVGRVLKFELIDNPPRPLPHGLLCLAEVTDESVSRAVRDQELWGLSMGEDVEISLTSRPALRNARVIGTGEAAWRSWRYLVGDMNATTVRQAVA